MEKRRRGWFRLYKSWQPRRPRFNPSDRIATTIFPIAVFEKIRCTIPDSALLFHVKQFLWSSARRGRGSPANRRGSLFGTEDCMITGRRRLAVLRNRTRRNACKTAFVMLVEVHIPGAEYCLLLAVAEFLGGEDFPRGYRQRLVYHAGFTIRDYECGRNRKPPRRLCGARSQYRARGNGAGLYLFVGGRIRGRGDRFPPRDMEDKPQPAYLAMDCRPHPCRSVRAPYHRAISANLFRLAQPQT